MDETLAKGFAKQFLFLLADDLNVAGGIFKNKVTHKKLNLRNTFKKFTDVHQEVFGKFLLSRHVGGSKRRPYIGFIELTSTKTRTYRDWEESGLYGLTSIFPLSKLDVIYEAEFSSFFIVEHAISRVFQRSGLLSESLKSDPYIIISEMNLIPFWAAFWSILLSGLNELTEEIQASICPVIPSKNGLFLCKVTKTGNHRFIEVRTYIHESSLTEPQKNIRNILLEATKTIENSQICLYPYFNNTPSQSFNESALLYSLILHRLRNDTYQLCEILLFEKNEFQVYEFDKSIRNLMIKITFPIELGELISQAVNDVGYKVTFNALEAKTRAG